MERVDHRGALCHDPISYTESLLFYGPAPDAIPTLILSRAVPRKEVIGVKVKTSVKGGGALLSD
ncbi:MAG TPA: hypothetical protein VEO54_01465 [Thermoanaerobaculia bacterium]|nr:hypothetical protein [Thermoanaerobaculia bacterium]